MQEMSLTSFWIIAGSCVLVLGIMILKNRARFALNFLVRAVLGACAIACVNKWLAQQGIMLAVGINPALVLAGLRFFMEFCCSKFCENLTNVNKMRKTYRQSKNELL